MAFPSDHIGSYLCRHLRATQGPYYSPLLTDPHFHVSCASLPFSISITSISWLDPPTKSSSSSPVLPRTKLYNNMSISRAALLLLGATVLGSSTAFTPISSSVSSWRNQPLQMISKNSDDQPLLTSRKPQKLKNGRGTFLGFQNAKDVKPQGKSSSSLGVGSALYPDGGLSPCVIRVLGVGGGGCNAVSYVCCSLLCRQLCVVRQSPPPRTARFLPTAFTVFAVFSLKLFATLLHRNFTHKSITT